MRVCIIGAGNIGLAITAIIAKKDNVEVVLYTSKPILNNGALQYINDEAHIDYSVNNFIVTDSFIDALKNTDIVLCTYPAFLRKQLVVSISRYLKKGCKLGFVPGYGGAEFYCKELISSGIIIFGFQRVPYVARAQADKRIVRVLSEKQMLFLASIPHQFTKEICKDIENLLDIPCMALNEYLAVTLVPSNPLLHTCGVYNIFRDYEAGKIYEEPYMFYDMWNDETSKILVKYDDELQLICKRMSPLNLDEVISLQIYYESPNIEKITRKLKSIPSFKQVKSPMKKTSKGYVPDFNSRMFREDFPFGVCIIKSFALLTNTNTPIIDMLLKFYERMTGICYFNEDNSMGKDAKESGILFNFGLDTKEKVIEFYRI